MSATLRLNPENAALSIKARLDTIRQCEAYIRETVASYDGLKAFENLLVEKGLSEAAHAIADRKQGVEEGGGA